MPVEVSRVVPVKDVKRPNVLAFVEFSFSAPLGGLRLVRRYKDNNGKYRTIDVGEVTAGSGSVVNVRRSSLMRSDSGQMFIAADCVLLPEDVQAEVIRRAVERLKAA